MNFYEKSEFKKRQTFSCIVHWNFAKTLNIWHELKHAQYDYQHSEMHCFHLIGLSYFVTLWVLPLQRKQNNDRQVHRFSLEAFSKYQKICSEIPFNVQCKFGNVFPWNIIDRASSNLAQSNQWPSTAIVGGATGLRALKKNPTFYWFVLLCTVGLFIKHGLKFDTGHELGCNNQFNSHAFVGYSSIVMLAQCTAKLFFGFSNSSYPTNENLTDSRCILFCTYQPKFCHLLDSMTSNGMPSICWFSQNKKQNKKHTHTKIRHTFEPSCTTHR